jgi:cytochrome c553
MKRALRVLKRVLAGLAALVAIAVIALYGWSAWRMKRRYDVPVVSIPIPVDAATIARGKHLAENVALCSHCHGADFGGTKFFDENPLIAQLPAPNLTRGKGGIGGIYTDIDWLRAVRHGVAPGGRALIFMPSADFAKFSAEDVDAIIAYVSTRPPVDREWPAAEIGPIGRAMLFANTAELLPVVAIDHTASPPVTTASANVVSQGEHLTRVAGCQGCHGPDLTGGQGPPPGASNITPVGVGDWTESDFVRTLRTGVAPGNRALDPAMPRDYGRMTDAELHAIWTYLRTVSGKGEKTARQNTVPGHVRAF